MTTVYLIRHCEAVGNIHRRLDGIRDTDITPFGARQIFYLAQRFHGVALDALYCSGLTRAIKTAQGIGNVTGKTPQIAAQLHERRMGVLEGKSWYGVKEQEPQLFHAWNADMKNYVLPDGESECGAGERFRAAVTELALKHPDGIIAIVAHSMVIKAFIEMLTSDPVPYGNNTAVSCFLFDPQCGDFRIQYLNDDSHLPQDMQLARQRWFEREAGLDEYSIRYEYPQNKDGMPTEMPANIPDQAPVVVKGYEADTCVGYAEFEFDKKLLWIREIWIEPDCRRRNYATELIGEMLYQGKRRGCTEIAACVTDRTEALECLMRKNGFARKESRYCLPI